MVSVLSLLVVAIAVSGILYYVGSARAIERRTFALSDRLVSQIGSNIDFYIADIERLSQAIIHDGTIAQKLDESDPGSREPSQTPVDADDVQFQLLMYAVPFPSIQGIYLFANDGAVYFTTHGKTPRIGYEVGSEPWYYAFSHRRTGPFLLWPTASESSVFRNPEKVISLVRQVSRTPGTSEGYLKIDLRTDQLWEFLPPADSTGRRERIVISADDGRIVYDSTGRITGLLMPDLSLQGLQVDHGWRVWEGQDTMFSARRSSYTGWTTWLLFSPESIAAESRQTAALVFLVCTGAVLLIGLALQLITGRTTRHLRLMATTLRQVEAGDLSARVPAVESDDEVGRLSRVFNRTLDSVEHLVTQVLQARLRERDAQLLALQAQINPHFLFNTLNSICILVRSEKASQAVQTVESLADMFRYSMSDWHTPAKLSDELAHVSDYAAIQKVRLGRRFSIDCQVPPELLDARVVKLSLQPLVENAVKHGQGNQDGDLSVVIRAEQRGDSLAIVVADNGVGIEGESLSLLQERLATLADDVGLPTADVGIGLINIDRRAKLLYGPAFGLSIESARGQGTTVTMLLPWSRPAHGQEVEAAGDEHRRS